MRIIDLNRRRSQEAPYYLAGRTRSKSSAWAFDRFRLYTASFRTMVMVKDHNGNVVDEQPFSSTLSFEHDFTFDLSGNVNNDEWEFYIKGIPSGALFKQIYAYPTGFGSTRGKNAELTYWNLNVVNPTNDATTEAYLRLENQPIDQIDGAGNIMAKHIYVQNTLLPPAQIDALIIGADNSGITGGTFNWTGLNPTLGADAAYNSLAAKAWTLTGPVPAEPPVLPGAPTISVIAVSGTYVMLDWDTTANATSYRPEYRKTGDSAWIAQASTTATNVTVGGLTPGVSYDMRVVAVNADGEAASNVVTRTTTIAVPANLRITDSTPTSLRLDWNAVTGALSYRVRLKKSENTLWTESSETNLFKDFTGLQSSTSYDMAVRADGEDGNSAWSSTFSVTTPAESLWAEPVADAHETRVVADSGVVENKAELINSLME